MKKYTKNYNFLEVENNSNVLRPSMGTKSFMLYSEVVGCSSRAVYKVVGC